MPANSRQRHPSMSSVVAILSSALFTTSRVARETIMDRTEMKNDHFPIYGRITGPIVMIGFGSIGKGMLPLIERHFEFDKSRFTVIDPVDTDRGMLDVRGVTLINEALTPDNYRDILTPLLTEGGGQG